MLASITSLLVNRHADDRLSRQKETDFVIFEQHESFSFKNFTPPPHFLVKHYLSIFTYDLPHCSFLCLIILVTDFERGIPFLFMYKKTPMRKTGISQSISSKHNKFFLESSDFLCFNKENLIQQSPSDGYRIKQIYILSFSLKKTSLSASLGLYTLCIRSFDFAPVMDREGIEAEGNCDIIIFGSEIASFKLKEKIVRRTFDFLCLVVIAFFSR